MKKIGIYKITSPSGRVYIGQGTNIEKRWSDYRCCNCKSQVKLYNSFMKYGSKNHIYEILEECKESELNNRERHYQDLYDVIGKNGLNCRLTKSDDKSGRLSEEHKRKISESEKGKIVSKETRKKISLSNKGKKLSDEHKKKIGDFWRGKKRSPEILAKVALTRSTRDYRWSEEKRNNYIAKNARKVINTKTGQIFDSSYKASEFMNWPKDKMGKYLRGERVNHTDFLYLEDYNKLNIN